MLDSIRRIVRHLRVSAQVANERTGVPPAQLFVLSRLREAPATSIRDLAQRTMTDPSSVSVVVSKLEARGLVARKQDERDARRFGIEITTSGRAALRRAPELPQVRLLAALEALAPARRKKIASALEDLVIALGAEGEAPALLFEEDRAKPVRLKRPS